MAPQGTLCVRPDAGGVTFRLVGRALMAHGLRLRKVAEQFLAGGADRLRVDLRDCTYMDSTFLGTLLFLKRAAERRGPHLFALIAPSAQCGRLLRQMGVDDVFPTVVEDEPAEGWVELGGMPEDASACRRGVLEAHEELATLSGAAGESFREVMRCLQRSGDSGGPRPG
jgi:anti-anti-sigma factor